MAKGKYEAWLTPEGLMRLEAWARDGLTDEQIAHNMRINVKTLWDWKTKYDPICSALKKGKAPVDIEVENALFKRATGYTVKVNKPIKVKTKRQLKDKGTIEEEHIELVEEEIYIAPDTTAQIYWLNNRRPDRWRTRKAVEIQTEQPHNELLQSLFDLEREARS